MQKNTVQNTRARSTRGKYNTKYQSAFQMGEVKLKIPERVPHAGKYTKKYQSTFRTRIDTTQKIKARSTRKKIQQKLPELVPLIRK